MPHDNLKTFTDEIALAGREDVALELGGTVPPFVVVVLGIYHLKDSFGKHI